MSIACFSGWRRGAQGLVACALLLLALSEASLHDLHLDAAPDEPACVQCGLFGSLEHGIPGHLPVVAIDIVQGGRVPRPALVATSAVLGLPPARAPPDRPFI